MTKFLMNLLFIIGVSLIIAVLFGTDYALKTFFLLVGVELVVASVRTWGKKKK